jgi:hypothetical protein
MWMIAMKDQKTGVISKAKTRRSANTTRKCISGDFSEL